MPDNKLRFPDPHFAVFNLHVNNAGKRAMRIVVALYGIPAKGEEDRFGVRTLRRDYRKGIMRIFYDTPMSRSAVTFAEMCFVFANGLDKEGQQ